MRSSVLVPVLLSLVVAKSALAAPPPAGDLSCEAARAKYVDDYTAGTQQEKDLAASDYAAVLDQGSYLGPCSVPADTALTVCAAVQEGVAVGVTVTSEPRDEAIESCVATQVRSLEFPSHPRMDVATTKFAPASEETRERTPIRADAPSGPAPVEPKAKGCACAIDRNATDVEMGALAAVLLVGVVRVTARRRVR